MVESSGEVEQQRVYREYSESLVAFIVDCYQNTVERLNSTS